MDILLIALIVLAVISVGGWGYGTYGYGGRPVAPAAEVVAAPGWVSPLGVLGLIAVVGIVLMLATQRSFADWRITLVATDINEQALEAGRRARFSDWALRSLAPSTVLQVRTNAAPLLPALAGLAKSVPCFSLELSTDIDANAAAVAAALEGNGG